MAKANTQGEGAGDVAGDAGRKPILTVTARGESFRRAGFGFGPTPRDFYEGELTPAQVEALTSEPHLVAVKH